MSERIRILIAEDHRTVREAVKLLISEQSDMEVIGEAGDGEEAIRLVKDLDPDLLLMDVSMPGMNGVRATKELRKIKPELRILTLTRHQDDGYLRQLVRAGSNGYVLKQSPPDQLINAIRAVGGGESFLDPSLTQRVLGGYSGNGALRGELTGDLSAREEEVLRMVALGYANKEIAARLDLSVKTVEAHKASGIQKLGLSSKVELIQFAIGQEWLNDE